VLNVSPSTTMAVLDSEENIGGETLGSRLAFLKIKDIHLSIPLSNSELLRFFTTVRTAGNKSRATYTLFDPGTSHGFVDISFAKLLGIVPRHYCSMVVTAVDQTTSILD
jgi:hypothetical protein